MSEYTVKGREVFSAKGKLVATITEDGNLVMAPGMAGAHKRAVEEFLVQSRGVKEPPPMPPLAEATEGRPEIEEAEGAPEPERSNEEYVVSTIPADRLPPFSKELGVNTPGFAEFVNDNHLSAAQVAALVRRLSR